MTRPAVGVAAFGLLVGLTGCGGDDAGPPESAGGSTASALTSPSPRAAPSVVATATAGLAVNGTRPRARGEAAVYDAYVAYWRAAEAALGDPRAEDPALELTVDPQRLRTAQQFSTLRRKQQHAVGQLQVTPSSIKITGTRAILTDCLDDSKLTIVDAAGLAVPGSAGNRRPVTVVLVAGGGDWYVSDIQVASGAC